MEIHDKAINAFTELLSASDHDSECPLAGNKEAEDCPCGYAKARLAAKEAKELLEHDRDWSQGF